MNITQKPTDFQYLFLDMNSFFASVEKQVKPKLRTRPIGVTPHTGDTGCIIAACYQAKDFGVKTGDKVGQAKKICPEIKIVEARPALYMIYHREIKKVVESFSPFYQTLSVDEFIIRLDQDEQNKKVALKLGQKIKDKITTEVGDFLTCSVGVGPNNLLSKMAAESKKPDGLTILELKNLKKFYNKLKLTDIPGIAQKTQKKLNKIGIDNPSKLYQADLNFLKNNLGVVGRSWFFKLRGYQLNRRQQINRSIGHSSVLAPKDRTKKKAQLIVKRLAHKVGERLRKNDFWAEGVGLSISFLGGNYSFKKGRKVAPFRDNNTLNNNLKEISKKCSWQGTPLKVGVRVFNLTRSSNSQLNLFKDIHQIEKISQVVDQINSKFGDQTISSAAAFEVKNRAPNRISFNKPDYEID